MIISHTQIDATHITVRALSEPTLGDLSIEHRDTQKVDGHDATYEPIRSYTYMTVAEAEQMLVAVAEHLFDTGAMTMSTAERLSYLTSTVLMDPSERTEAMLIGMGEDF